MAIITNHKHSNNSHDMYDMDGYNFRIDPETRKVVLDSSSAKITLMQYDHNSEQLTFVMPRFIEGHDMKLCNKVQIHYTTSTSSTPSIYEVRDVSECIFEDGTETTEGLTFTWTISQNVTRSSGTVTFVVRFECTTSETVMKYDEDEGREVEKEIIKLEYAWSTYFNSDIQVLSGMNNGQTIIEQNIDLLEQWRNDILSNALPRVSEANENCIMQVVNGNWTLVEIVSAEDLEV